jgi:Flp pilus assembly protein TadG
MIELALVLPVLLVLLLGVVDFGRAIHYSAVIVNMSREGANLAARASGIPKQDIIKALVETAEPLKMKAEGMIYITEITGRADGRGDVQAQWRATTGDTGLRSRTYVCTSFTAGGVCNMPTPRPIVNLGVNLTTNDRVYAVEVMYDYQVLVDYVMKVGPDLYARTLL